MKINQNLDTTITDNLVCTFGKVRAEIEIAIWESEPNTSLHRGLVDRLVQVNRAWDAFQSVP